MRRQMARADRPQFFIRDAIDQRANIIESRKSGVSMELVKEKRAKWYREKVVRGVWSNPGHVFVRSKRKFAAPSAQTPTAPKDSNILL